MPYLLPLHNLGNSPWLGMFSPVVLATLFALAHLPLPLSGVLDPLRNVPVTGDT